MDVPRPDLARKKRRRRWLILALALLVIAAVTVGLTRLQPAVPTVARTVLWSDTVKRGEMLCQVRGNGVLLPEQIQFVQAESEGRVERILVKAGAAVQADTILIELSNPELKQSVFDAAYQLKAAVAQLTKLRVQLESERLAQKALLATLKSDAEQAMLLAEADETLSHEGLVPILTAKQSRAKARDLEARVLIEQERLQIQAESAEAQRGVAEAEVEKVGALLELKQRQLAGLSVRAGIDGVLQQIGDGTALQVGQRINPSATLAKIVQPTNLMAEIKIAETQAKDVLIGQRASIDTRNGVIPGRVMRVDPAVLNGTVTVDVKLEGALPKGARPDLSVDGLIELDRLDNALHVGRPVQGQSDSTVKLFKIVEGGEAAIRVPVKIGRSSVSTIEIINGLEVGDQVILSDMSAWDSHERIKLE